METSGGEDQAEARARSSSALSKLLVQGLCEFVNCLIFICAIGCIVSNADSVMAPLAIGSTLMVLVYSGGHVSGAHFNPAVSVGIFIRDETFGVANLCVYMLAQFVGAAMGGLIAAGLSADYKAHMIGHDHAGKAFFGEFIFTYLLVSTVLNVATSDAPAYANNSFFALAIGFSVVVGATAVGSISGGAFNPAVAFGVEVGCSVKDECKDSFKSIWIHLLADFLGGAVAGLYYRFITVPFQYASQVKPKE